MAHIQSIKTFFTPSHLVVSKLRVQQSRRLTSAKTNSSSNIAFNVGHESWHSVINTVKQNIQILVLFFKHFRYARLTSVCVGCNATLNGGVANFGKFYFICIEVITWQTGQTSTLETLQSYGSACIRQSFFLIVSVITATYLFTYPRKKSEAPIVDWPSVVEA